MASPSTGECSAGPPVLSAEIWDYICSHLSKPALFQLRLASRSLGAIALHWAYRSLRMEAFGTSAERFASIARTPELRGLVRELTIDTWIADFDYNANELYEMPEDFMNNLPCLRFFGNLRALHLRFSEYCGEDGRSSDIEETWNLRYRVLDTVCHCVAGMWTLERQEEMDNSMEDEMDLCDWRPQYPSPTEDDLRPSGKAIHLRELTIANLADYHEPRLSEAWKTVLALPSLVDLKLFVVAENCESAPEHEVYNKEKYEFFDELPCSWLAPAVAEKLQVLSLFCQDYWGWFPKMDFRQVALPQLRVLALGNYVFSHEWQAEWFASLGKENSSGGLEELYLDDCPILLAARQLGPLSSSDPGYPALDAVMNAGWDFNPETHKYPLRWHQILTRWADAMGGLRVFHMGHGTWGGVVPEGTIEAMGHDRDCDGVDEDVLGHRASHRLHRNFACPRPTSETWMYEDDEQVWRSGRHLRGTGMERARNFQMQYIQYDIGLGPTQWVEVGNSDWPLEDLDPVQPELRTEARDDAAFEALMAAVEVRAGLGFERLSMRKPS